MSPPDGYPSVRCAAVLRGAALCDCAGFRLTLAPRSWRQGGGAGVYCGSFPVWASGFSPEVSEVTPPDALSHSALRRLPSGQAQGVPAEDGHNSPRRQSRRLPPPVAGGQDRAPEVDILTYQYRHAILPVWTRVPYGICLLTSPHAHLSHPIWTIKELT